jgi:hypothetical protein
VSPGLRGEVTTIPLNFPGVKVVSNNMFCPRCGKSEQLSETYCRQCGLFLPDLSKPVKRELPPEEHLKANTVLSVMTIVVSFTLSILLFAILGIRSETHPLIYVTAGLLIAIGAWHIQTLIRTLKLKKQWKRRTPFTEIGTAEIQAAEIAAPLQEATPAFAAVATGKLLDEANLAETVPASVTENTTRHLVERLQPKSS